MQLSKRIALIGIGLLLMGSLSACDSKLHSVRYEVSGTASRISISYTNQTGATEQKDIVGSWSAQYTNIKTYTYMTISAFNPSLEDASVKCRLYVDNVLVQSADSQGALKTAACSTLTGTIPTPTKK